MVERHQGWKCGVVATLAAWALAAVFLAAGIAKASTRDDFTLAVWQFEIVPWGAAVVVAGVLPWIEMAVGAALLVPRLRVTALWLAAAMLLGFMGALASAWARGLDISCGCFGGGEGGSPAAAIARNLVFLGLVGVSLVAGRRGLRPSCGKP